MKILFIGFNAKYINPTNQLVHRMLKLFADVVFYGPGFVGDKELRCGISAFCDEHGPFDFIATTTQLAAESSPEGTDGFYRRFSLHQWGTAPLGPFMADVKDYMRTSSLKKISFLMDLDTHGVRADLLEQIDKFSDYIVAWGKGFSRPNSELPYLEFERAYRTKAKIGLWHSFCESRNNKFINIGHFVGLHEFDFSPISVRQYPVSVAGQLYFSRERTLTALKRCRQLRVGSTSYRRVYSLLTKIGWSPYSHLIPHTIYRTLFKQLLCTSKISMTDGGAYDMMIRKFVEIPAAGALMLARPCAGFEALGFRDGESAVILDEADPVGQVLALLETPDLLQSIADKGQQLVWSKHSIHARAQQMAVSLGRIKEGRFVGSLWSEGEFKLIGKA